MDKWNRPIGVMFIATTRTCPAPTCTTTDDRHALQRVALHTETAADTYWYPTSTAGAATSRTQDHAAGPHPGPDARLGLRRRRHRPEGSKADPAGTNLYKYQWNHNTPPAEYRPGDPKSAEDVVNLVGGFRAPGTPPKP